MFSKYRPTHEAEPPMPARNRDAAGGRSGTFSIIGADVEITGDIKAGVDLHIDGTVNGDVACASLVQGADSVISGGVSADSAKLAGTVEGSIEASDLTIEASAHVQGDVTYETLIIEQGGKVEGHFRHKSSIRKPAPAPEKSVPEQSAPNVEPIGKAGQDQGLMRA